ncbi:MAG: hypothetical protein ACFE0S_01100 [Rhodospirillales bacterium]
MEFEELKKNPAKHFEDPGDVVAADGLSRTQKLEILRQWQLDAELLSVAESENMPGERQAPIASVRDAIRTLEQ